MNTTHPLPPVCATADELTQALWFSLLSLRLKVTRDAAADLEDHVAKFGWVGIHPKAQESIRRAVLRV